MLHKNLQELTDKIYQEGVEKARAEKVKMLDEVKQEAQTIIAKAEQQAQEIIERAEQQAQEIRRNNEAEMKLAARQALSSLKQKVVNLIVGKVVKKPLEEAFKDEAFIKQVLEKMIFQWVNDDSHNDDLRVLLSEQNYKELRRYFVGKGAELLQQGVRVEFKGKMKDGFVIGPEDGRYKISYTSEDFENYFKSFLRPRSFQLLFGAEE